MKAVGEVLCWVLAPVLLLLAVLLYRHMPAVSPFVLAGALLILPPSGRWIAKKTGYGGRLKQFLTGIALVFLVGPIVGGVVGGLTAAPSEKPVAAAEPEPAKAMAQLSPPTERPEPTGAPAPVKQDLTKVVFKITKSDYPKTYQKWGKAGVDRINSLMLPAAELVAESPACGSIDYMGLSEQRSTKGNIVFFVDCAGTERFYVDEAQIKERRLAASENQKAMQVTDAKLLQACKDQIRARLNFPSTFDPGWFGTSVYRAPAGKTVATIDFEAKNALGLALPHRAKCFLEGNEMTAVEISPR